MGLDNNNCVLRWSHVLAVALAFVASPAPEAQAETALEALLREDPRILDNANFGWLERAVLEVLTPEQHAAFVGGAEAQSLVLDTGETLADFIVHLLSKGTGGGIHAAGTITASAFTVTSLDCTANANGGALTADASGVVSCSDDDGGGPGHWSSNGIDIYSTNSGEVGIGTMSPVHKLEIHDGSSPILSVTDDTNGVSSYMQSGDSFATIGTLTSHDFAIRTNDSDVVTLKVNGNVGIGLSNPGEKLSVAGFVHSVSGGFKFPDGSVQSTAAGSSAFDCATMVQTYSGIVELSCPSGYVAVSASCNQGVGVVLHGQTPGPVTGSWIWYLIPNANSATGVHCQQSPGFTSQIHLRCCR